MTATVRKDLAALLVTQWAAIPALAGVRIIATERALDDVQQPTCLLRAKSIARSATLPNSHRDVGILATLISQHEDPDQAQDELDTFADAALDYFDTATNIKHGDAVNVAYGTDRLATDINLTVMAKRS